MKTPPKSDFVFETGDHLWTINVLINGRQYTTLTAVRNGLRLLISDLVLESEHLKHRGIGSQILDMLIAKARSEGIADIYGSVTQDDIENTPYLIDWYQRHGFVLTEPDQECIPGAKKKIVLTLR